MIFTLITRHVLFVLAAAAPALAQQPSTATCGTLVRWRLPATLVVEATEADTRTHEVRVTQARIDGLAVAAEAYCRLADGEYPASLSDLMNPPDAFVEQMRQCPVKRHHLSDAWGRPIFYAVVGRRLIIASAGADGVFSTVDDIGLPALSDRHAETYDWRSECVPQGSEEIEVSPAHRG